MIFSESPLLTASVYLISRSIIFFSSSFLAWYFSIGVLQEHTNQNENERIKINVVLFIMHPLFGDLFQTQIGY
jgi:hypothetical protein